MLLFDVVVLILMVFLVIKCWIRLLLYLVVIIGKIVFLWDDSIVVICVVCFVLELIIMLDKFLFISKVFRCVRCVIWNKFFGVLVDLNLFWIFIVFL